MKYVIIGIIVVIALLVWVLNRRGTSGLGSNGSTDTIEGTTSPHRQQNQGGFGNG